MKKAVKGIIGLSAALAVLGGGLAALKLTEPEKTEESSSASSEVSGAGVTIIEEKEIAKVELSSVNDEMTIVTTSKRTEESAALYTIDGYQELPVNTSMVGTIPNNARGLVSASIVAEDCTDTAKYGFDEPQATAEIYFESGENVTLIVGDATPSSSAETYVMLGGDDTVYTVPSSKVANYTCTITDLMSSTILKEPAEEEYPVVKSVVIERDDIDYNIVVEYDELSDDDNYTGGTSASHIMVEPTKAYLAVERSTEITNGLFGLSASEIYSIRPDEADIAEAGLSEPFCTMTMTCDDGNEYVFIMSEPFMDESGKKAHYAMLEGVDIIYTVSAENAKWGTVLPIDIASKIIFGTNVWSITELTVTGRDIDDVVIEIEKKESAEGKDSFTSEDFTATKNGEPFDAERYRTFYRYLIQAPAEEFALNEPVPSEEPIASITFNDSYTGEVKNVEFYDYSALKALVVINGKSEYYCPKSYAETIIENVNRMDTGEEYLNTWK